MINKFKDWFTFSKGERTGILVLSSLIIILIGIKIYLNFFKNNEIKVVDFSAYEKQIDEFSANLKKSSVATYPSYYQNDTTKKYAYKPYYSKYQKRKNLHIELNTADTSTLKKVYGIGKVLSIRIIKYRDQLGGFYNKKQLLEIYGIKPENYQKIKSQVWTDTTKIKKIDMNDVTFKKLLRHPYMNLEQVKKLMKYKDRHRIFTISQLQTDGIFDKDLLNKMKPYMMVSGN